MAHMVLSIYSTISLTIHGDTYYSVRVRHLNLIKS